MTKTAVRFFHNQGEWMVWNRVKGYLLVRVLKNCEMGACNTLSTTETGVF